MGCVFKTNFYEFCDALSVGQCVRFFCVIGFELLHFDIFPPGAASPTEKYIHKKCSSSEETYSNENA